MSGNFLAVIDGTFESKAAVRYAARRAEIANTELVILVAIDNQEQTHWLGVEKKIIEEAENNAKLLVKHLKHNIRSFSKVKTSYEIRHGSKVNIVNDIITENGDIAYLVIASDSKGETPGELVEAISKSGFSVPVVVIPGYIDDESIDKLLGIE